MRHLSSFCLLATPLCLAGCWNTNPAALPADLVSFSPEGVSSEGWLVQGFEVNLDCPDGRAPKFYLVHPAEQPAAPLSAVVLYHSGSFDYVLEPTAEDPVAGPHFLERDSRLTAEWAIRRIFVTLGMYPDDDPFERHEGLLPAAFTEQGVAVLLPPNCWGDFWHNRSGISENDFNADFFFRNGRVAAEWGYRLLTEPEFAMNEGVSLPVEIDPSRVFVAGLGEGGRAVGELISIDEDNDNQPDYSPAGLLVDSTFDDLRVFYDNPDLYGDTIAGLDRIFPGGRDTTTTGGLAWAPALPPTALYVYSTVDTRIPNGAHNAVLASFEARGGQIVESVVQRHVLLNADDLDITRQVVADLLGTAPFDPEIP